MSFGPLYLVAGLVVRPLFEPLTMRLAETILISSVFYGVAMSWARPFAKRLDNAVKRLFSRRRPD